MLAEEPRRCRVTFSESILLAMPWGALLALIIYDATREQRTAPDPGGLFKQLRPSMVFPSIVWLFLIGCGASLAAVGTLAYNLARDREKASIASQKAISLLKHEIARNLQNVTVNRQALNQNGVVLASFETAAWTIAINAGLLTEVDQPTLDAITDIYYRIELAERHRRNIIENSQGMASALANSGARVKQYQAFLLQTLDELEPQLRRLGELHP